MVQSGCKASSAPPNMSFCEAMWSFYRVEESFSPGFRMKNPPDQLKEGFTGQESAGMQLLGWLKPKSAKRYFLEVSTHSLHLPTPTTPLRAKPQLPSSKCSPSSGFCAANVMRRPRHRAESCARSPRSSPQRAEQRAGHELKVELQSWGASAS